MYESSSVDRDAARLQRFRHFPLQVYDQHAIDHRCLGHLDEIGQLELPREGPISDAAVQVGRAVLVFLFAAYREVVLRDDDLDVVFAEPSQPYQDAVAGGIINSDTRSLPTFSTL